MNKLTITRNGVTVQIEQDAPISADIIAETIKAMDKTAMDTPIQPWTPPTTPPWTIPKTGTKPWDNGSSILYCAPQVSHSITVTPEQLEERRKQGLLSYTTEN